MKCRYRGEADDSEMSCPKHGCFRVSPYYKMICKTCEGPIEDLYIPHYSVKIVDGTTITEVGFGTCRDEAEKCYLRKVAEFTNMRYINCDIALIEIRSADGKLKYNMVEWHASDQSWNRGIAFAVPHCPTCTCKQGRFVWQIDGREINASDSVYSMLDVFRNYAASEYVFSLANGEHYLGHEFRVIDREKNFIIAEGRGFRR